MLTIYFSVIKSNRYFFLVISQRKRESSHYFLLLECSKLHQIFLPLSLKKNKNDDTLYVRPLMKKMRWKKIKTRREKKVLKSTMSRVLSHSLSSMCSMTLLALNTFSLANCHINGPTRFQLEFINDNYHSLLSSPANNKEKWQILAKNFFPPLANFSLLAKNKIS